MVDVDGVLVTHPNAAGWRVNLERDLGVPPAILQEAFFARHWADVVHGRAALRERLAPVLAELAPAAYLWDRLDFRSRFCGMHYAAALGCSKPAPQFYRAVEARTGLVPADIFFIDDQSANVAGARACGWTAAVWTGAETVRSLMAQQRWTVR